MVQVVDYCGCLLRRREIGEGQASENTVVEVVVKCIWQRQVHVRHQLYELLFLGRKRDVLDDDGGRNEFLIGIGDQRFGA